TTAFRILVNAQAGEHAVTNPESGDVPESIVFPNPASSIYKVTQPSNIRPVFDSAPDLQPLLDELRVLTVDIHRRLAVPAETASKGKPQRFGVDMEFKLMKEGEEVRLYLKQARLLRAVLPE
ncbi:MAG: hypothetical protein AAF570_28500, partial [Bacteroidota bacterium]